MRQSFPTIRLTKIQRSDKLLARLWETATLIQCWWKRKLIQSLLRAIWQKSFKIINVYLLQSRSSNSRI